MNKLIKVALALTIMFTVGCSKEAKATDLSLDEEKVQELCELSSLKCIFHNVAKTTKDKGNDITSLLKKNRTYWVEYYGEVTLGVKFTEDCVKIDNKKRTVTIDLPKATILHGPVTLNEDDGKEYTQKVYKSNDSFFVKNKITLKDQKDAKEKGNKEMLAAVKKNKALYKQAKENAEEMIKSYYTTLNSALEDQYTITVK